MVTSFRCVLNSKLGFNHKSLFKTLFAVSSLATLVACSATKPHSAEPPIIKSKPTVSVASKPMKAITPPTRKPIEGFDRWLNGVRQEALAKGIKASTLDAAFDRVRPIRRVVELDRKQPEFKLTYKLYMDRVVPISRIIKAREKYKSNKTLIDNIANKYGVQSQFLVAFWGLETNFGRTMGGFPIISSLATLAYDGRRGAFFRKELMNALQILDEGHVQPNKFKGSWAGAMGQCQFMPSTFVHYAVDGDGDGRIDLWGNKLDIFSSAANYLSKSGWKPHRNWGLAIVLPKEFDRRLANKERISLKTWAALGVMDLNGRPVPSLKQKATLILPHEVDGQAFLVFDNFHTIMKWNRSTYYALAVGQLADAIIKK